MSLHIFSFLFVFHLVSTLQQNRKNLTCLAKFGVHCAVSIGLPLLMVSTFVSLHPAGVLTTSYNESICWIENTTYLLALYIIPALVFDILAIVCVIFACSAIREVNQHNTSVMLREQRRRYGSTIVAVKLIMVLGSVELIGACQILADTPNHEERVYSIVLAFAHSLMRSVRGIVIGILKYKRNPTAGVF